MLNKKASYILIFLILFSLGSTFFLQTTVKSVKAQEELPQESSGTIADQAFVINKDWLDVTAISFGGHAIDSGGKYGRLNVDVGGFGMKNFVNKGEIAYDEETDTHVYMAEMNFVVSAVVYTDCMIDDVYTHRTNNEDTEWLKLWTCRDFFLHFEDQRVDSYEVEWNYIEIFGTNTNDYDGNLRLNAKVNPVLPIEEGQTLTMNGLKFDVPNIRTFIDSATLIEQSYGTCDDPQNFYTDNEGVIEVRKEEIDSTFSGSDDAAEDRCGDGRKENENTPDDDGPTADELINECGIHNRVRYYGVTFTSGQVGQDFASAPAVGSVWSRSNDLNEYDEIFEFDSHLRVKPNVFYDEERFDVVKKTIQVDTVKEQFLEVCGVLDVFNEHTDTYTRIVGLGVQNLFIRLKYNFKVVMLLSIVPQSEEGEDYLEDPVVHQGDIVWDNSITGTTDAEVTITEEKSWWTDLLDGVKDWFSGIGDWFDSLLDDILGGWTDWWDKFGLWIIIIIAIVVVVIVLFVVIRILPKRRQYGQPSNTVIGGTSEKKVLHR